MGPWDVKNKVEASVWLFSLEIKMEDQVIVSERKKKRF